MLQEKQNVRQGLQPDDALCWLRAEVRCFIATHRRGFRYFEGFASCHRRPHPLRHASGPLGAKSGAQNRTITTQNPKTVVTKISHVCLFCTCLLVLFGFRVSRWLQEAAKHCTDQFGHILAVNEFIKYQKTQMFVFLKRF